MPATIVHTIIPGGGGDYSSIESWNAAQARNLVAADEIAVADCHSGGNLQASPTVRYQPSTWTTDGTRYVIIRGAAGHEHVGVWDTAKAYMLSTRLGDLAWMMQRHVRFEKMQMRHDTNQNVFGSLLYFTDIGAHAINDRCFILMTHTLAGGLGTVEMRGQLQGVTFRNCVIMRHSPALNFSGNVVFAQAANCISALYNCDVIFRGPTGGTHNSLFCRDAGSVMTCNNNYYANDAVGVNASYSTAAGGTINQGASDASSVADVADPLLDNVAFSTTNFVSVTLGSEDLELQPASVLVDAGDDLSGVGVIEDIRGISRPGGAAYDVGAFERSGPVTVDIAGVGSVSERGGAICDKNAFRDGAEFVVQSSARPNYGQTFTGCGGNLLGVMVKAKRVGSPGVSLVAKIYAHTGTYGSTGKPTGAALATSTNIINPTTLLPTTGYADMYFIFSGAFALTYGTRYCVALESAGGSFPTDQIHLWAEDDTGANHAGNAFWGTGGVWTELPNEDLEFVVYSSRVIVPYRPEVSIRTTDAMDVVAYLEGESVSIESIWNTALVHLGEAPVVSTSDTSPNADLLNVVWADFFKEFLTDHPWNGAKTTAVLSRLLNGAGAAIVPPDRWAYVYALPANYLQAVRLNGRAMQSETTVLAEVESILVDGVYTNALFTHEAEANLEYVFDVGSQVTLLKPKVRQACGLLLAARIAPQFGKTEGEIEGYRRRGDLMLADARSIDGQENTPQYFAESTLITSRRRGGF